MTTVPLCSPDDLYSFPGYPFSDDLVAVASADIRAEARWHIAPVVTETVTVFSTGERELFIPSKRIVSVTLARSGVTVLTFTEIAPGVLWRPTCWPIGRIEVDLTHGYDSLPKDLLPVIASRARNAANPRDPSVASRTVGQVAESYRDAGGASTATVDPVVARYAVPAGVA